MTTTTLVHRVYNGPRQWWRDSLVYEITSSQMGAAEVSAAYGVLDHVASLGFTVVLLRPSMLDIKQIPTAFASFARQAHQQGLKVITRVSGARRPVTGPHAGEDTRIVIGHEQEAEGLLTRIKAFLEHGADGVDLGLIVPPDVEAASDLDLLSSYMATIHALVAEYVEEGVIGADVSADYPEALRHHLQDDWLHHLRDDTLILTRWDAGSLQRHITLSLKEHDRFGAPPAWRHLPSFRLADETDPGDGRRWFETDSRTRMLRSTALQALMLALPGAVYLRQGDETAILDEDKPSDPHALFEEVNKQARIQGSQFGSPLATVRHATYVRRERNLATAALAFVTGMPWCPPGALSLLVRDVLVLVNTTPEPIHLPEHAEVLLSSASLMQSDGVLVVPPTTTVWLVASTVA